jgi:signal transduction histidine kinase
VEAARPLAQERGIKLVLESERVPLLAGDAGRIGQAVDNLISNALKFTPEDGRVTVRLRRDGDSALLEVSDSGIGIPPDELDRLFDRFYRASTAHERAVPGVGLGLTIVRAIVDGHGGTVRVASSVGHGTTFTVELPVRRPTSSEQPTRDPMEVQS